MTGSRDDSLFDDLLAAEIDQRLLDTYWCIIEDLRHRMEVLAT